MEKVTSAHEALERIQIGGSRLLITAQSKLVEAKHKLEEGDFTGAHTSCEAAFGHIMHLAQAQAQLGLVADRSIVAAEDVQVGMTTDGGQITAIEPCPCEQENCAKRLFTFENGAQIVVMPDAEFVVR